MRTILFLISFVCVPAWAAKGKATIFRGGLGFLYNDHNSFSNPGQFALDKGFAFSTDYRWTASTSQSLTPSLVMGTGGTGFGVFASRQGTVLTDPNSKADSIGAGVGIALDSQKITLGLKGSRSLESNPGTLGDFGGSFSINGPGRSGFSVGVGATSTYSSQSAETRTGTTAIGYGFGPNTYFELNGLFQNWNDWNNFVVDGVLTYSGDLFYFSGLAGYLNLVSQYHFALRTGCVWGAFDLSGLVQYSTEIASEITYGISLRVTLGS